MEQNTTSRSCREEILTENIGRHRGAMNTPVWKECQCNKCLVAIHEPKAWNVVLKEMVQLNGKAIELGEVIVCNSNVEAVPSPTETWMRAGSSIILPIDQVLANQVEREDFERVVATTLRTNTLNNIIQKKNCLYKSCGSKGLVGATLLGGRDICLDINVGVVSPSSSASHSPIDLDIFMHEKCVDTPTRLMLTLQPRADGTLRLLRRKYLKPRERYDKSSGFLTSKVTTDTASQMPETAVTIYKVERPTSRKCRGMREMRDLDSSQAPDGIPCSQLSPHPSNDYRVGDDDLTILRKQSNSSARYSVDKPQKSESNTKPKDARKLIYCKSPEVRQRNLGGSGNFFMNRRIGSPAHQVTTCVSRGAKISPICKAKSGPETFCATNKRGRVDETLTASNLSGVNKSGSLTTCNVVNGRPVEADSRSGEQDGAPWSYTSQGHSCTDDLSLQVFLDADYGSDAIPIVMGQKVRGRSFRASTEQNDCTSSPGSSIPCGMTEKRLLTKKVFPGTNMSKNESKKTTRGKSTLSFSKSTLNGVSAKKVSDNRYVLTNKKTVSEFGTGGGGQRQSKQRSSSIIKESVSVDILEEIVQELVDGVVDTALRTVDIEECSLQPVHFESESCDQMPQANEEARDSKTMKFIVDRGNEKKPISFNLTLRLLNDANQAECPTASSSIDYHVLRAETIQLVPERGSRGSSQSVKLSALEAEEVAKFLVDDALHSAVGVYSRRCSTSLQLENPVMSKEQDCTKITSLMASVNGREKAVLRDGVGTHKVSVGKEIVKGSSALQLAFSASSELDERNSRPSHGADLKCLAKGKAALENYKCSPGLKTKDRPGILIQLHETPPKSLKMPQRAKIPCVANETGNRNKITFGRVKKLHQMQNQCAFSSEPTEGASVPSSDCLNLDSTDNWEEMNKNSNFSTHLRQDSSNSVLESLNSSIHQPDLNEQGNNPKPSTCHRIEPSYTTAQAVSLSANDTSQRTSSRYDSINYSKKNSLSTEKPLSPVDEPLQALDPCNSCQCVHEINSIEEFEGNECCRGQSHFNSAVSPMSPSCLKSLPTNITLSCRQEPASRDQVDTHLERDARRAECHSSTLTTKAPLSLDQSPPVSEKPTLNICPSTTITQPNISPTTTSMKRRNKRPSHNNSSNYEIIDKATSPIASRLIRASKSRATGRRRRVVSSSRASVGATLSSPNQD